VGLGPFGQGLAAVARIREHQANPLNSLLAKLWQGSLSTDPVVFVGWSHVGRQQQAAGVDQQLALAALNFFVAVKALVAHAALPAVDGLGIQDGHARARLARGSGPLAVAAHQGLMEPGPAPVSLPAAEIIVDQRIGGKLARQEPPLAAALRPVEQRVDKQAQRGLAAARIGQDVLNNLPLEISQVRFVHLWSDEEKEETWLISFCLPITYNS